MTDDHVSGACCYCFTGFGRYHEPQCPKYMSDTKNGNGRPNIAGAVTKVTQSMLTALPPGFFILLILNIAFLGFIVWFLEGQLKARDNMAEMLFNRCMEIALPHRNTP